MWNYIKIKFKNSQIILILLLLVFGLFLTPVANAEEDINQQILDLRSEIEELIKQAEQYKGTIAQKQKQAKTLQQQIDILENQIKRLETSIIITGRQITSSGLEIINLEGQIFDAQREVDEKRQAIGELISFLYQRDKLSLLAILLKSPRLSSFTNEAEQAENLNKQLTGLLVEIRIKKQTLEENRDQLSQKKTELEDLNKKQTRQKISLSGNKVSKDDLLINTKGEERRYQELLAEVERKQAEFFNELKRLENEAVETGAFIIHVTASSVPPKGSKIFQWPYDDYFLTQGYGMTTYAKRGAYGGSPHNGIDMAAGFGTPIRSVASGAILTSGFNNGFGNWVAVRHDNGLVSVYAHMRTATGLANATPVSTGSIIGYEGSTGNSTGSHLHLSAYRDFFTYINNKNGQLYFNYFDGSINPFDYLP